MIKEEGSYQYTYSAKQQAEVEKIRLKYLAPTENKMEQLRQLDQAVTLKGTIYSIVTGVVGSLIFGLGLSVCLVWADYFVFGLLTGLVGLLVMGGAYPVYVVIVKKSREKIAPDILRLTSELLK